MAASNINGFDIDQLQRRFHEKFGRPEEPPLAYFAPGRVNLIGDHTDFTGGLVFPCGIDRGTLLLIRRTTDQQYRFASTNFDLMAQLSQSEINQTYGDNWINYPLGVLDQFIRQGVELDGVDCLYSGNVPNGAGLSSSASIEVVTAFALNTLFDSSFSLLDLVKISQKAENEFVGMQCGIMDQFVVAMAEQNHALMLDCSTLDYRQVPLDLKQHTIIIVNTNQRRELNESAYNDRVNECARALALLQTRISITKLGELTPELLAQHEQLFEADKIALRRATHVCNENARVASAVTALEADNFAGFGKLMYASHASLRDNFEVSSEPLDHLVRIAREQPGVLGSRLTGAGFGGCTVNILNTENVVEFIKNVGDHYQQATGLTADFYTVHPSAGVRMINS